MKKSSVLLLGIGLITTFCLADKVIPLANLSHPTAVEVSKDNAYIVERNKSQIYLGAV